MDNFDEYDDNNAQAIDGEVGWGANDISCSDTDDDEMPASMTKLKNAGADCSADDDDDDGDDGLFACDDDGVVDECGTGASIAAEVANPYGDVQQQQQQLVAGAATPGAVDHRRQRIAASIPQQQQQLVAAPAPISSASSASVKVPVKNTGPALAATEIDPYANKRQKRTFVVQKLVSLNELAANPEKAVWRVNPQKESLFQLQKVDKTGMALLNHKQEPIYTGNVRKAVIERVVLKDVDFENSPVRIAGKVPLISRRMCDENGREVHFTAGANERGRREETLYDSKKALEFTLMKMYGDLTAEKLKATYKDSFKHGHSDVSLSSPIISVMGVNRKKSRWQKLLKSAPVETLAGHKVKTLPTEVVKEVEAQIVSMLDKLPHSDMTSLSVHFQRLDGKPWNATEGILTLSDGDAEKQEMLNQKFRIEMEFEVTWIITSDH